MSTETVSWVKGQIIYKYNDESNFGYLLKEGEVEILSKKGIKVGYINEGEVFGEQSVLLGTNRTVSAKATKNCIAIKIPKSRLLEEYSKSSILIKAIKRPTKVKANVIIISGMSILISIDGDESLLTLAG